MSSCFRKGSHLIVFLVSISAAHAQLASEQITDTASAYSTNGLNVDNRYSNYVYGGPTLTDTESAQSAGYGTASGYLNAAMSPGVFHAFGSSTAVYPGNEVLGVVNESTGGASIFETVNDYQKITSATLAQGTAVTVKVSLSLDGSFAYLYNGYRPSGLAEADITSTTNNDFALQIERTVGDGGPLSFQDTVSMTYHTSVGATIGFTEDLDLTSVSNANPTNPSASEVTDCSNTSVASFQVLTPGATLSFRSGGSYATPEPSQFLVMGLGLVGLFGLKTKKSKRP